MRRISLAVVYVRSDLDPSMLETCLQEEIYQSFGLFGDYTGSTLFSFCTCRAPYHQVGCDGGTRCINAVEVGVSLCKG